MGRLPMRDEGRRRAPSHGLLGATRPPARRPTFILIGAGRGFPGFSSLQMQMRGRTPPRREAARFARPAHRTWMGPDCGAASKKSPDPVWPSMPPHGARNGRKCGNFGRELLPSRSLGALVILTTERLDRWESPEKCEVSAKAQRAGGSLLPRPGCCPDATPRRRMNQENNALRRAGWGLHIGSRRTSVTPSQSDLAVLIPIRSSSEMPIVSPSWRIALLRNT